jgi:hypothetical protein
MDSHSALSTCRIFAQHLSCWKRCTWAAQVHGHCNVLHNPTLNRKMWDLRWFAGHDLRQWGPMCLGVADKSALILQKRPNQIEISHSHIRTLNRSWESAAYPAKRFDGIRAVVPARQGDQGGGSTRRRRGRQQQTKNRGRSRSAS